ncbi:uncharacterized protein ACR2FA_012618 [Aphomia sociella]
MYKLVVLSAFLALAVAEPKPGAIFAAAPYTTYGGVVVPATTTITKQASSVLHPSPYFYNSPIALTHYIKKRSAPLTPLSYIAPSYLASAPFATTYGTSFLQRAPVFSSSYAAPLPYVAGTHFIKKRSAPLLPTTYIAPTTYAATTPLLASTYTAASPLISTPLISSTPIISHPLTHFIKKRSPPFIGLAPTSYSHQSRIDLHSGPLVHTPFTYSLPASPIAYSHNTTQTTLKMMKLVVLSCLLAAASAGLITGIAPLAYSAPLIAPYNYRGPLSLAPGQPANILASDGRPLDTLEVNLDRSAHLTAKALDGLHLLKKRSAPLLAAPLSRVALASPLIAPAASVYAAPIAAPIATHISPISYAAPVVHW